MTDRTKKILVVVLFIIVVFGIGTALYFAFFKPAVAPEPTVEPTEEIPGGGIFPGSGTAAPGTGGTAGGGTTTPTGPGTLTTAEEVAQGGVTQVTTLTTSAVEAVATSGNSINFYNPQDGKFYTIDAEGNLVAISDKVFMDVENVAWNGTSSKAVLEFPDGSNIVYDFSAERQVTLPTHWEDFEFSPESDEILAKSLATDPNNRWLVVTNSDGSNVKAVTALGENESKVEVNWSPNNQVIGFADTAEPISGGLDRKMILPLGTTDQNFKGLIVEGLGFQSLWSPSGSHLLYSVSGDYSDNKPLLWIVDATPGTMGENRRSLGLNTWVDKCAFADNITAYCAVPVTLPTNAGTQRSLYENNPDHLYKLDLSTGRSSRIAIPETSITMDNLSVSEDGSLLYFTNHSSGRLQLIHLK